MITHPFDAFMYASLQLYFMPLAMCLGYNPWNFSSLAISQNAV